MEKTDKLLPIKGQVQNYAWGGLNFIPELLNIEKEAGKKYAEYWLGAHNNAPSSLSDADTTVFLNDFLNENPIERLGEKVNGKFGRLPFLFKVLDVNDMLSIQVHPSKESAEKGFKRENELNIPLTASNRNYKDDNHKPEIMVALSEFWLLHGFLESAKLKQILQSIPEFNYLAPIFEAEGYKGLYKKVMLQAQETTNAVLQPLVDRILPLYENGSIEKSSPDYWAAKAVVSNPATKNLDKGIFSIYFFNIVKANKGEAVFQDAGIPHAYLEGQNMELMANSDNVLRGGLTPKHIDEEELLKHVVFEETIPNILQGDIQLDGIEKIYKSPAPDFELSQLRICDGQTYTGSSSTVEILIVLEGTVTFKGDGSEYTLSRGESLMVVANSTYTITTSETAVLYKATAP